MKNSNPKPNSKSNCVIGLCVKNNKKGLPKVFDNISKLCQLFDKLIIVVYYDESNDNSFDLLRILTQKYELKTVILNANCKVRTTGPRTVDIARARNGILKYIYSQCSEYEMFIMMDSNHYSCVGDIKPDVLEKYLNNEQKYNEWDALSFLRKPYYDFWAYSDGVFQLGCWTYPQISEEKAKELNIYNVEMYQKEMAKYMKKTIEAEENKGKLVEVDSAFCGFALYKKSAFKDCYYNGLFTTEYMDKVLLEKNLELYKLPGEITKIKNMPDCEHRFFHMMAKKVNNAKIMVACEPVFEPYQYQ